MAFSAEFLYKIVDKMTPVMRKFRKENEAFAKQMRRNTSIANTMQSKLVNLGKAGERALNKINVAGKQNYTMFDNLKRKAKEAKKDIASTFQVAGAGLKKAADKTRRSSLVAAASIIGMVSAFSRFEKGTDRSFALMNSGQIKKYREKIESLEKGAIGLGFSIQDSTNAMHDNISGLGIGETALSGYKGAIILARAGSTDLTSATKGIISVLNAYGLEADKAESVSSALFVSQKIGVTTVEEMSGAIGRLAPIARASGLSYVEMATSLAVMTKGGLSTEESATAMRAALSGLIKPSKQAARALHDMKIPMGITAVKGAGIVKTLRALKAAIKDDEDAVVSLMPNIRALTGVLSLSEENLTLMDKAVKKANSDTKAGTEISEAYAGKMNLLSSDILKAKGSLTLLAIEMGEKLKPIVTKVMKAITFLADEFLKAPNWLQNATLALLLFTAALSPLASGAGLIFSAIAGMLKYSKVIKGWTIWASIATKVQWLWNAAILANPIGAIVVGIILLVSVIALVVKWMWTSYDAINAWFDKFGIVGKIIKFIALGPLFWLVTAIKESVSWMKKLGWISDDTAKKTNKFAEIKNKLQSGKDTTLKLQEERSLTDNISKAKSQPEQKIGLYGQVDINDKAGVVDSVESTLMGVGDAGLAFGGL